MIIAVGFKVNNDRAVRFRKWSGQIVKDHTIQGWTIHGTGVGPDGDKDLVGYVDCFTESQEDISTLQNTQKYAKI